MDLWVCRAKPLVDRDDSHTELVQNDLPISMSDVANISN
jgi:hypothetical protein